MEPVSIAVGMGIAGFIRAVHWLGQRSGRKQVTSERKLLGNGSVHVKQVPVPEYHIESDGTRVRVVESRFWLGPGSGSKQ